MAAEIIPLELLEDNYAYLVAMSDLAIVVDPSEARPVERALKARGLRLVGVLNTHHHLDHTGGNEALKKSTGCRVFGPHGERQRIRTLDQEVKDGDRFELAQVEFQVIGVPGHTRSGVAYYCPQLSAVFTGDTLFLLGCGRLFEGTASEMAESLETLAALPGETRLYCGHEYTRKNAAFCLSVFPDDPSLQARVKKISQRVTVPGTIAEEKATNPFLRVHDSGFRSRYFPDLSASEAFALLRAKKDAFV